MAAKDLSNFHDAYNIHIVSKHVQATDAMKNHILDKLGKLERISDHIIDVIVRLDIEKTQHRASITLKFGHFKIRSHAVTTDLYASIDKAIERIKAKMSRWKSKMQDHHARKPSTVEVDVMSYEPFSETEEINDMIDEENQIEEEQKFSMPKVATTTKMAIKSLTMDEAIMKMELSSDNFMLFKLEEDQKLKVIYRKEDESYGVIAPE